MVGAATFHTAMAEIVVGSMVLGSRFNTDWTLGIFVVATTSFG